MKKSRIVLVLCMMVVIAVASVAGTIAWLTDTTDPVVNTFTTAGIDITLTETTGDEYKMVPGATIAKDPKVTVLAGSEASWVFVKIEKSDNFDTFMEFDVLTGKTATNVDGTYWTKLEDGVYYCKVNDLSGEGAANVVLPVIESVHVLDSVTKEMMAELTSNPTLTFTAYVIQQQSFDTASDAWDEIGN